MNIKLNKKKFIINFLDGIKFSKKSKDTNPIHIDKIYGYNSIFGENILHGVLTIIFFLKMIRLKKNLKINKIGIKFLKPGRYDKFIKIKCEKKRKKNYNFLLIQENKIITNIELNLIQGKSVNNYKDYEKIFEKISYYTGVKYPGKNSLIHDILIEEIQKNQIFKNNKINSKLLDPRLPIVKNHFYLNKYKINFTSIFRPIIKWNKTKPNKLITKTVNKINHNILIIGASQGVGRDLLHMVRENKKIFIIGTYFKNKIKVKEKNVKNFKLDVEKNLKLIKNIIKKFSPLRIYYFATQKILFDRHISKEKTKEYENFFFNLPLQILKENKSEKISFFYPSTDFINFDKKSPYSIIKLKAEKKLKKFCIKNKIKFISHRLPAINSRQSISISNQENQNLKEYFLGNKKVLNKILL